MNNKGPTVFMSGKLADMERVHEAAMAVTKAATDGGTLIETGFLAFRAAMLPNGDNPELPLLRLAFLAGGEHVFSSIMGIMDSDEEPTKADLARMDRIYEEVERIRAELRSALAANDDE